MTPKEDVRRKSRAISGVAEYYGKPLPEGVLALYLQGLSGYPAEEVERAIMAHIRNPDTGQWMPKISDIVRAVSGTTQSAAAMAWGKLLEALRRVGTWQSVAFDDPVIHLAAADLGGWREIGQGREADLSFLQHRFEKSYRAYAARRNDLPPHPTHLPGICEAENSLKGCKVDPPVLVGDPERAMRVFKTGSAERLCVSAALIADAEIARLKSSARLEKAA